MKTPRKLSSLQLFLSGILFLLFTSVTILLFLNRPERQFSAYTRKLFLQDLQSNTLTLHYTLEDPSAYHIPHYPARLPLYSKNTFQRQETLYEEICKKLSSFDPAALSPEDSYTLCLYKRYYDLSLASLPFLYYDDPLSPHGGVQTMLPLLLSDYSFRSKKDVEEYLTLLSQTGKFFASVADYQTAKFQAGLSQADGTLEKVILQCDTIVTKAGLDAGSSFLQTSFREKISALRNCGLITGKEAERYLQENNQLLANVLLPAYQSLSEELAGLRNPSATAVPLSGLASKPDGVTYYKMLFQKETGCYLDLSKVKKLLESKAAEEHAAIKATASNQSEALSALMDLGEEDIRSAFPLHTSEEMLSDLRKRISTDFPLFKGYDGLCLIRPVSDNLAPYSAPAFYLTSPVDTTKPQIIYINEKHSLSGLELYTTLAHEGYPGHLYQTLYTHRSYQTYPNNLCRELLWYGGYLEGWALYAEFLSYDYASCLFRENMEDSPTRSACILLTSLQKQSRSLQLCLYSLLDIRIHSEGLPREEVLTVLSPLGVKDQATADSLYEYIVEEPVNYPKYYVGFLEILRLKERAKKLWGDKYSEEAFHRFVLDCGPSDFPSLFSRLNETPFPIDKSAKPTYDEDVLKEK